MKLTSHSLGEEGMKKLLLMFVIGLFAFSLVAGCGQKEEPKTEPPVEEPTTEAVPDSGTVVDSLVDEAGEAVKEAADKVVEEAGH